MRVLVTGAAGFYGSNLVNVLLSDDKVESIIGVDNYMHLEDFPIDPFNIIEDKKVFAKKFTFLKQDYRNLTAKK